MRLERRPECSHDHHHRELRWRDWSVLDLQGLWTGAALTGHRWSPGWCGTTRGPQAGVTLSISCQPSHAEVRAHVNAAPDTNKEASAMTTIKDAAREFLGQKRNAVAGVSRRPSQHGANVVYRRLRDRGYDVFAVNP